MLVDQDLDEAAVAYEAMGVEAQRDLNQAIGVLIDWGHPPDTAGAELDRRALRGSLSRLEAARELLAAVSAGRGSCD